MYQFNTLSLGIQMAKIYQFRGKEKTFRQMISAGRMTDKIKIPLQEAYLRHEALYPDDPDTAFIKKMLTYKDTLSSAQQELLTEILKYEIEEEEHPNGILDITFRI